MGGCLAGREQTPPALRVPQLVSSHTSVAGVLDEQAECHGAQVFAAKANRQTVR